MLAQPVASVYKDQSPSDLRLCVTQGALDPYQFTVVASHQANLAGIRVSLHILGESHCIVFEKDGRAFTETLSCASSIQQPEGCSHSEVAIENKKLLKFGQHAFEKQALYQGTLKVIDSDASIETEYERLFEHPAKRSVSLCYRFPSADPAAKGALTGIRIRLEGPRTLRWESLHAYPSRKKLAVSSSRLDLS